MAMWARTPLALCIATLQTDLTARHQAPALSLRTHPAAAAALTIASASATSANSNAAAAAADSAAAAAAVPAAAAALTAAAQRTLSHATLLSAGAGGGGGGTGGGTAAAAAAADNGWSWRMHDAHDLFEDDSDLTTAQAMIAGACAGVSEHVVMFPVDTLKTRLQEAPRPGLPVYHGLLQTFQTIRATEGLPRLYSGLGAVVLGAIPSHAVHFATLEFAKSQLGISDRDHKLKGSEAASEHQPVRSALAGASAALAHDAVVTPADVIKQRLQMWGSAYRGVGDAIARIAREEGVRAFYASYPTTVLMNVPNTAITVATYESLKRLVSRDGDPQNAGPLQAVVAGGGAGAIAGACTTPLDVLKTRIQLFDAKRAGHPVHPLGLARQVWRTEGWRAFTKGMSARVVYNIPSAAICWTTYETVKTVLKSMS